jgi:Uma2 family endonuclease
MTAPVTSRTAETLPPWQARAEELMRTLRDQSGDIDALARAAIELSELLPAEDGKPMESPWHRAATNLLIESVAHHFRGREDYYVGGNMIIYYLDPQQAMPGSKGPDFFYVRGVTRQRKREKWAVFREGKFPHVIVELLSPSTAAENRQAKKDVYEQIFETNEYFLYDPTSNQLEGWRLNVGRYEPVTPDGHGRLWSEWLEMWLGAWSGVYQEMEETWPRFHDREGNLILTRAETAEAEVSRLRATVERFTGKESAS